MNSNTVRELALEFLANVPKAFSVQNRELISHKQLMTRLRTIPIFKLGIPEHIYNFRELASLAYHDDRLLLPFNSVIVLDQNKDLSGAEHAMLIMGEDDGPVKIVGPSEFIVLWMIHSRQASSAIFMHGRDGYLRGRRDVPVPQATMMMLRPKFKQVEVPSGVGLLEQCVDQVHFFVTMASCPRHYVVRVKPGENQGRGKSVEWVQAHSHYLILSAEHSKQLAAGRRDFDGTLTRAMHRRRAHLRLLQSDKFKQKKGTRIWVKSAWVGPTEWEGTGDKRVYTVLEKQHHPLITI